MEQFEQTKEEEPPVVVTPEEQQSTPTPAEAKEVILASATDDLELTTVKTMPEVATGVVEATLKAADKIHGTIAAEKAEKVVDLKSEVDVNELAAPPYEIALSNALVAPQAVKDPSLELKAEHLSAADVSNTDVSTNAVTNADSVVESATVGAAVTDKDKVGDTTAASINDTSADAVNDEAKDTYTNNEATKSPTVTAEEVANAIQEAMAVSGMETAAKDTNVANSSAGTSSEGNSTETGSSSTFEKDDGNVYHLKWFEWKGEQTPIVMQNVNGPCPLLGIANVLILARKIVIPPMQTAISASQLTEYIGDCILDEVNKMKENANDTIQLNYEQNMNDALSNLYKLQIGLDVNVKFSGVDAFEYTSEQIVFDLLQIALYHGWLVDPQDEHMMSAIDGLSYNQLVEKIITSKDEGEDSQMAGLRCEEFLLTTASQLTYHGLCELNSTIQDEELCVFFRNNHFSTLYKHKSELFLLVTDQGFLTEPNVIWETLINIEGDGHFVNAQFKTQAPVSSAVGVNLPSASRSPHPELTGSLESPTLPPVTVAEPSSMSTTDIPPRRSPKPDAFTSSSAAQNSKSTSSISTDPSASTPAQPAPESLSQEDKDYLLALSLSEESGNAAGVKHHAAATSGHQQRNTDLSDHQLALRLQRQEEDQARAAQQQHQQQQQQQPQQQQLQPPTQQQRPVVPQQQQQQPANNTATGTERSSSRNNNNCTLL